MPVHVEAPFLIIDADPPSSRTIACATDVFSTHRKRIFRRRFERWREGERLRHDRVTPTIEIDSLSCLHCRRRGGERCSGLRRNGLRFASLAFHKGQMSIVPRAFEN